MAGRLEGMAAFVSGAGSIGPGWGNGKAAAVLFAREGARVLAVDIDGAAAEETRAIVAGEGGECIVAEADVTDDAAVAAAVETAMRAFGRIDVLHNNVGIVVGGGPADVSPEEWERGAAVNLRSVFLTTRHVLPHMRAQGGGAIVNVSSIAANRWMGVPYASYAATKAALLGLSRNIALQYAPDGIRCNCVLPGIVDTPLLRNLLAEVYPADEIPDRIAGRNRQIPMRRMGDAWDVAHAALYLASDDAKYVTGAELVVDGGLSASAIAG